MECRFHYLYFRKDQPKKKFISMRDSREYIKNIIFQDGQSLVTKLVIVQRCNFIQ